MIILLIIILALILKLISTRKNIADSHGPISIMGDHVHKNEYMFSYRLMKMEMKICFRAITK